MGARQGVPDSGGDIGALIVAGGFGLGLPILLAAFAPRRALRRYVYLAAILSLFLLLFLLRGSVEALPIVGVIPAWLTLSATGLFIYFWILSPFTDAITRIGVIAPFAALLGAVGGAGYLSMEGILQMPFGGILFAVALAIGIGAGVNVSADFIRVFAEGENARRAAAAAGHGAVAPSAFSLLAIAILAGVYSFDANFGEIQWRSVWGAITIAACSVTAALMMVTASLVLRPISDRVATEEQYRRRWFVSQWRPVRLTLPAATATAIAAVAGIVSVIAVFEKGFATPGLFFVFLFVIGLCAAMTFVSVRTSLLVMLLLVTSTVLGEYFLFIVGVATPDTAQRFASLTLIAVALGAMTASWRDAGETWRNARDIVQNALSDGTNRYVMFIGTGTASFLCVGKVVELASLGPLLAHYVVVALFALILAPAFMTALSARVRF